MIGRGTDLRHLRVFVHPLHLQPQQRAPLDLRLEGEERRGDVLERPVADLLGATKQPSFKVSRGRQI